MAQNSQEASERRGAARWNVPPYPVRVEGRQGYLVDISETGALIHVAYRLPPDGPIQLQVELDTHTLSITARVVRCASHPVNLPSALWMKREYRVGVKFAETLPPGAICWSAVGA